MPEDNTYSALEKIDFGALLTAPLKACVDAQAQAATATADYIENVGFAYDDVDRAFKPVTVSFVYRTTEGEKKFTIPLITVVPVPYLQIHNVHLAFSTELSVTDNGHLEGKVSTDDKNKKEVKSDSQSSSDLKVNVNIKASSSDMPMGISQLLRVMQNQITLKALEPNAAKAQ